MSDYLLRHYHNISDVCPIDAERLITAQVFEFEPITESDLPDRHFWSVAGLIASGNVERHRASGLQEVFDARFPADKCLLLFGTVAYLVEREQSWVRFSLVGNAGIDAFISALDRSNRVKLHGSFLNKHGDVGKEALVSIFRICCVIGNLLCEPRLIKSDAAARHKRKRFTRACEAPLPVWHEVRWRPSSEDREHGTDAPEARMPLHFCRAHWRKAEEGWPTAERRPDHDGWWTFIKSVWKGHPDFGVKLHKYVPDFGEEGARRSAKRVETSPELSDVRKTVLDGASASAIEQWHAQNAKKDSRK